MSKLWDDYARDCRRGTIGPLESTNSGHGYEGERCVASVVDTVATLL